MTVNASVRIALTLLLAVNFASCAGTATNTRFLTIQYLNGTEEHAQPLPMAEFATPADADGAIGTFTGVLTLIDPDRHGDLAIVHDPLDLIEERLESLKHLPSFEFSVVQRGVDLVPVRRGVIRTAHPNWEYVLQPGRVWHEPGDESWSRAALPFALQERSANCTHNGMLTFAFDRQGNVSRVAYQISSETCAYLKVDMWGIVSAAFEPGEVKGAGKAISRLDAYRSARLPVKPVALLAVDYPGFEWQKLAAADGVKPEDMSVYGFVIDGVNYRGGCATRHGSYPFCDELALPSYSTAKSIFAAVALMRMQKRHPGMASQSVASLVPECHPQQWSDVSLENTLDMATGNYKETAWDADEDSLPHVVFLDDDRHATKIAFACTHFQRRAQPGSRFVYHTSDTYVLGTAMQNYVERRHSSSVDIYEHVVAESIWSHLNLSPLLDDTKRTYDAAAQPFAGYGLTYEADDIVRIARWLSQENGWIDGVPALDEQMLAASLQRDPDDRGLATGSPTMVYNNGFWGFNAAAVLGCDKDVWIPFMSGYGGISVVMLPNDTIYYYFSDGYVHRWSSAVVESDKLRSLCE